YSHSRSLSTLCSTLDLPSFPTRRSSDLCFTVIHRVNSEAVLEKHGKFFVVPSRNRRLAHGIIFVNRWAKLGPHCIHVVALLGHPDRKSTRLNSSHVSISYAVFCLKKKKS